MGMGLPKVQVQFEPCHAHTTKLGTCSQSENIHCIGMKQSLSHNNNNNRRKNTKNVKYTKNCNYQEPDTAKSSFCPHSRAHFQPLRVA